MSEIIVEFLNFESINDEELKFVVIVAKYRDKYIFCKHKKRNTWELPGGHIEKGETILEAGKRELIEETGVSDFDIERVCVYDVRRGKNHSYGALLYANVYMISNTLDFEIEEIKLTDELPCNLTYPDIQTHLFNKSISLVKNKMR